MKWLGIVLLIFLTGCIERLGASSDDYQRLDLSSQKDPEILADTPDYLDPYNGEDHSDRWNEQRTPQKQPFSLETFHGDKADYHAPNAPLHKVKAFDSDRLFTEILACYPAETLFNGELKLQATASPIKSRDRDYDNYYAKVVWEMPLYSTSEVTRRLDRENQRRQTTAEILGHFSEALARKNQALRMVSLYRSLEHRSQERVAQGITGTEEQIGYLEKTANAHSDLLKAQADVTKYRLQLVSLCTDQKAPRLNNYLRSITGGD